MGMYDTDNFRADFFSLNIEGIQFIVLYCILVSVAKDERMSKQTSNIQFYYWLARWKSAELASR